MVLMKREMRRPDGEKGGVKQNRLFSVSAEQVQKGLYSNMQRVSFVVQMARASLVWLNLIPSLYLYYN